MRKFASVVIIPLFAGFLWAQQTETRITTTTTYNGTLLDAGCYTTHTEHKETVTKTPPDENNTSKTTRTETTNNVVECPVTTTTTTFGLLTPEGRYVRFDEPSNTRIIEVVKSKKEWKRELDDRKPIKVRVVGKPNGDVIVLESIR